MNTKDNIKANENFKGVFKLEVKNLKGEIIETYIDNNLIVDKARFNMARLISIVGNNSYITKIGFGIGTTAPDVADLNLTSATEFSFDSITYPDNTSVSFNWSLGVSDMNGVAITEFGLISNSGDLFARKTRVAINKESDFTITGTWTIIF
jgi:hypothetical protein